ncbi:hypothetical protein ACOSQ2_012471 [Xanthoceras sorbifolium]
MDMNIVNMIMNTHSQENPAAMSLLAEEQNEKKMRRDFHRRRRLSCLASVNIPDDLLENIFSFLPIRQAVRMGVVSPRFRYSWRFSRKLHFEQGNTRRTVLIRVIDRVFRLHRGPIIKSLRLSFIPTGVEACIHRWIEKAAEKKLEELDLDFGEAAEAYRLPPGFYNIQTIKVVKLHYCEVDHSPTLKGLTLLTTLILKKTIHVTTRFIEIIFENCMSLEYLDMTQCYGIRQMRIHAENHKRFRVLKIGDCLDIAELMVYAPTLRTFHYSGTLIEFDFWHVAQLREALVNLQPSKRFTPYSLLGRLLHDLVHVNVLSFTGTFLEGLCSREIKEGSSGTFDEMQLSLWQLKELQVFMEGANFCNVYDIACFLNNCPLLEKLFIDLHEFSFECGYFWEAHHRELLEKRKHSFEKLSFIKIKGFKYHEYEIELVKYLLKSAINLQKLVLVTPNDKRTKIYETDVVLYDSIMWCWKASPRAQIKVYKHFNERCYADPKHPRKTWF